MSKEEQLKLFPDEGLQTPDSGPVTCLGQTFENNDARRAHFTEELRKKLQDPEFRKIEGFPIGEDEDILKLSDPPYYTACPNPWIADFIEEWEREKVASRESAGQPTPDSRPAPPDPRPYHREPFAADVSEGKNDPIYNAHSYHTKVPHKAIMRYILHYTEPGDIVFDGFCGTGMTGVAAQMCGDRPTVESLGYKVDKDGMIYQQEQEETQNLEPETRNSRKWVPFSRLGARKAVLNDLSPAATFIAYNYNTPVDIKAFEQEAKRILAEVEDECGWMYETIHTDGKTKGKINYTVWSDVFICPECAGEVVFWDAAIDTQKAVVKDKFLCPSCNATLSKNIADRSWENNFDHHVNDVVKQAKQVPVLIIYSIPGVKGRLEKSPDESDLELIQKINDHVSKDWYPVAKLPDGYNTRQPIRSHGFDRVNHFYTKRNLSVLAIFFEKFSSSRFKFLFSGFVGGATKLNQFHLKNYVFGGGGFNPGPRKGTLYAPSISMEVPITSLCSDRLRTQIRAYTKFNSQDANNFAITTGSSDSISINSEEELLDYVFIDPPFGSNLNYSELSFIWESWFRVATDNGPEAIENTVQKKGAFEYRQLMTGCFKEIHRLLKPGRWMTVEFSNTKASVWNNIQSSLLEAGFIVANVSALDKKQGGINANISKTAVKQDLVISAYKPNGGFEERFEQEAQTEEGVWDFIRTHFKYLPVTKKQGYDLVAIPERDPRILYDQVIAYYVRKGYNVPIDSHEFQLGLSQRFSERDGMYFLPEQAAEYDRKKMIGGGRPLQQSLFISDEASAIEWLRSLLRDKPQSFQDINPQFMKEISGWSKNEVGLELSTLLEQNFLCYDAKGKIPPQIVSWMRRSSELRPIIEAEFKAQGIELTGNLELETQNSELRTRAKARWYVPDPNKAGDLEKLREKALLKEFEEYKQAKKKLKIFRLEAVRAGFKKAWQERGYKVIITVAEKIPNNVLEEDPKLLMWYDQAVTRVGGDR